MMRNSVWDDQPAEYAKFRATWLNARREQFLITYLQQLKSGSAVLEIGSGTGQLLISLASKFPTLKFVGLEPLDKYVIYAQDILKEAQLENLEFHTGFAESATSTPVNGARFDLILSNDVIHHLESITKAGEELAQLSGSQTRWIAIEPNCLNLYTFTKQYLSPGEKNFFRREFLALIKDSGWKLKEQNYLFLIPPFIRRPPRWLKELEAFLEGVPVLAGGVALELNRIR